MYILSTDMENLVKGIFNITLISMLTALAKLTIGHILTILEF